LFDARTPRKLAVSFDPETPEATRRAAAENELLAQIASSGGSDTEWWNYRTYDELGGLTPSQAWLRGDHDAVAKVIAAWYDATERSAERFRNDPVFMDSLRQKSAAIASRARPSSS
jgi:hypothetical protein